MSPHEPLALVTGASSGIGAACVQRLQHSGWRVLAGVRTADAVERVEAFLPSIEAVRLDVTRPDEIERGAARFAELAGDGKSAVVHCAGIAAFGPSEYVPPAVFREHFEVNVIGALSVTQAVLPTLRAAGNGRVVFLGSVSGRVAPPFLGPYSASKFALEALADCLRRELASSIDVALVEAGRIETPIWSKAVTRFDALLEGMPLEGRERYGKILAGLRQGAERGGGLTPVRVAEAVLEALTAQRPKARYVVGTDAQRRLRLRWLPDRLQDRFLLRRAAERRR